MKFSEYLRNLDSSVIFKTLLEDGDSKVFSDALYRKIEKKHGSVDIILEKTESLSEEGKNLLISIYLSGDVGYHCSDEDLELEILKKYLVYSGVVGLESRLFPFSDFSKTILPYLLEAESISTSNSAIRGALSDIAIVLGAAFNGNIIYKQNGELSKATTDNILPISQLAYLCKLLEIPEVKQLELITILIKTVKELGFIGIDSGEKLSISQESVEKWEQTTDIDILGYIKTRLWQNRYHGAPLIDVFDKKNVSIPNEIVSNNIELKIGLMILAWLGKITIIHNNNFEIIVSDDLVKYSSTGHVMPDFSTFIPSEIEPLMLFKFLQIGIVTTRDVVYQGIVVKDSVINSLAKGVNLEDLINLVSLWHGTPNLISSLEEWGKQFNELYVDSPYLAVKEGLSDTIANIPELQELIEPVKDYKMFRIKDGNTNNVSELLTKFGYDVRFPNETTVECTVNKKCVSSLEVKPNYSLTFVKTAPQEKSYFGKYSRTLRKLPLGELLKVINYAIYMDEQLNILYFGKECLITPKVVRIGDPGELEALTESGESVKYLLESIDKVGVIHNDS